jgi:hypothetical protein
MSHFTVLVVGPRFEEQLAPFDGGEGCSQEYLTFTDEEDALKEEYATGTVSLVQMPDGSVKSPWDRDFLDFTRGCIGEFVVPEHLTLRAVPNTEIHASLEAFVEDRHGLTARDAEMGRYGQWANPRGKWDWYELGGRWSGFFKLKPGARGECESESDAPEGFADSAQVGDIDFEGMRQAAAGEARERYRLFQAVVGGREVPELTPELAAQNNAIVRARYWDTAVIRDICAARLFPSPNGYADYAMPLEAFEAKARAECLSAEVLLLDGVWHKRGTAAGANTAGPSMTNEEWDRWVTSTVRALPAETVLTLVDCHR